MERWAGFARVYAVEVLCPEVPLLTKQDVLSKLRETCGAVAALDPTGETEGLSFHFPAHRVAFKDGSLPAQCTLVASAVPLAAEEAEETYRQTWDWPGAREAVARHRARVLVGDLMCAALPYPERLDLFQDALRGVLAAVPATALRWLPSGKFVDPAAWLLSRSEGGERDPLLGPINVRLFGLSADTRIMDTLGLAALGMPDLQCRYRGLDPAEVATGLHNLARHVFAKGDVLYEGASIPGLRKGERWTCRRRAAFAPPARAVVDLDPGPAYSTEDLA